MRKLYLLFSILFAINNAPAQNGYPCTSCLPDGIIFTTQLQIDNFQINYPGCTQIEGNASISGNDIITLHGLKILTYVRGTLEILYNDLLTDLTGLESLDSIGTDLLVTNNNSLIRLTGLERLTSVGRDLHARSNPVLISLTGLENLVNVNRFLQVSGNPVLQNMTGLEKISSLTGFLSVAGDALTSLTGLENLKTVGKGVSIHFCPALHSLAGLDSLTSIGLYLAVESNHSLTSLTGLGKLASIGTFLEIENNYSLPDLSGLGQLASIGSYLSVGNNRSLTSLKGLDNLTFIGEYVSLAWDSVLTDVKGLQNISSDSLSEVRIKYNPVLSACGVQSICEFLAKPGAITQIYENAPGCNSEAEVQAQCDTIAIETPTLEIIYTIFPNPATAAITVKTTDSGLLSITDLSGQQLLQEVLTAPTTTVDISHLPGGIYMLKVTGERKVQVGKIIKL